MVFAFFAFYLIFVTGKCDDQSSIPPLLVQNLGNFNISEESSTTTTRSRYESVSLPTSFPGSETEIPPNQFAFTPTSSSCHKSVVCQKDSNPVCFNTRLPYSHTGPALTPLGRAGLAGWAGLRAVPGCWATVQPLLCAVGYPKCDPAAGRAQLAPRHLCLAALKPCSVLTTVLTDLPAFLNCSDDSVFSDECEHQDSRSERARFNASSSCVAPLVPTAATAAFWPGVEGCGLACESPLLTRAEHAGLRGVAGAGAALSLTASLLATTTFLLDWRAGSRYPARAVFYLNLCLALVSAGWLAQFLGPAARQDIVCRGDGVGRLDEPGQGENLACTTTFILVYYFSLAGSLWLLVVSYTSFLTFSMASQPGRARELLAGRAPYFHMLAWSLPLVLTIAILATNRVEGSAISGICLVGYSAPVERLVWVLLPHTAVLCLAATFTGRTVRLLGGLGWGGAAPPGQARVRCTVARILGFTGGLAACLITALACHAHTAAHHTTWREALDKLVLCNLRVELGTQDSGQCELTSRPRLGLLQLELLSVFLAGLLCATWVATRASLATWRCALARLLGRAPARPVRLSKHQLIAQAFAKRAELQAAGRLSLSFHSEHGDPLGLGGHSVQSSGEFSSAWAAALPHLVTRRGGLCGPEQLGLARRNSVDSVSNISRSVSIRSGVLSWLGRAGEQSLDSSLASAAPGLSDLARLQSIYDEATRSTGKKRSKREFFRSHRTRLRRPWSRSSSRRQSTTSRASENSSVFSQLSQVLPAITLDPLQLKAKVTKKKFRLPPPGRSTDLGRETVPAFQPGDPTYQELEDKLRQLATASRTSGQLTSPGASLDLARPNTASIETQTEPGPSQANPITVEIGTQWVTPPSERRCSPGLPALLPAPGPASPLQHIEANVVSVRVLGPSSEDSSIPSSYERDYKLRRLSGRGKENWAVPSQESADGEAVHSGLIRVEDITIPALKVREGGAGGQLMRPREHHRGRRGAIVQKLPGAGPATSGENTTSS